MLPGTSRCPGRLAAAGTPSPDPPTDPCWSGQTTQRPHGELGSSASWTHQCRRQNPDYQGTNRRRAVATRPHSGWPHQRALAPSKKKRKRCHTRRMRKWTRRDADRDIAQDLLARMTRAETYERMEEEVPLEDDPLAEETEIGRGGRDC